MMPDEDTSLPAEPSLLDGLRVLDAIATAGPWSVRNERFIIRPGSEPIIEVTGDLHYAQDTALIVTLRNALPALLTVVEAAEAVVEDAVIEGKRPLWTLIPIRTWVALREALAALRQP